jgi:hypothetical protein
LEINTTTKIFNNFKLLSTKQKKEGNPMEQSRQNKYVGKVLAEVESFLYRSMEEWEGKQFDEAFELLGAVENELKAARSDYEFEKEAKAQGERKCILCGKMTKGSVGKAGIKWAMICQECKDEADNALLYSLKPIAQLATMYDELQRWLKGGEEK